MEAMHKDSCACAKSELDLFSVPPTQVEMEKGVNIEDHKLELANSVEQVPNTFTMKIINRLEGKIENLSWDINCKINALSEI